ncbi:YrdB family protein [Streptomyces sp. NPDC019531]|uniref:YrdB family protein n=1 Tax=Streptomyces sp. NPDC019531 TaxID=3365062 RepID=UPI003850CC71
MKTAKAVNLGVVFLTELGVLGSVWYYAYRSGSDAAPLAALFGTTVLCWLWGLFGSPRARFKLHGAARVVFEVLWFGTGVALLDAAGQHIWAFAFACVCAVSKTLAHLWDRRVAPF